MPRVFVLCSLAKEIKPFVKYINCSLYLEAAKMHMDQAVGDATP